VGVRVGVANETNTFQLTSAKGQRKCVRFSFRVNKREKLFWIGAKVVFTL